VNTQTECGNWTQWMDDENGGLVDPQLGEFEYLPDLRSLYDFCETPSSIECRTVLEPYTLSYETGQTIHCDLPDGLICFHEDNVSPCMNYKIRLCCPLPLENDELCVGDNLYKMVWQGSLTWYDADIQCKNLFAPKGFLAGLANLESNEIRNSVRRFIKNVPGFSDPKGKGYWIGCHDEENEGIFVWLNGEKVNVPDSAWYSYPNNKYTGNCDAKDGDQDCCQLWERPKNDPSFKWMIPAVQTTRLSSVKFLDIAHVHRRRCHTACDVWTEWMDDENGGLVDFEAVGEFELIEDLRLNYQICDSPSEMECRAAVEPYTPWDQTLQTLQCHLSFGLICFHDDNH
ncbi:mucin-5B-like, partial [Saccoglossus kowalevskii]